MPLNGAEVEKIADAAAKAAVRETLISLGLDPSDPTKLQRNFAQLDKWVVSCDLVKEKAIGTSVKTAVGFLVTGLLGAVVLYFREHIWPS